MTVITHTTPEQASVGRHSAPDTIVPVVPGYPQPNPEYVETSAAGFSTDGIPEEFTVKPLPHDVDVPYVADQMHDLLSEVHVSDGIRRHVHQLLTTMSKDPRDRQTYGELRRLQTHLSRTINDDRQRQQHGEMPLTGHDRLVAQRVLRELVDQGHRRDSEAIAVLEHALSVGQAAVETEAEVVQSQQYAAEPLAYAGTHHPHIAQ
jgi:hypothetical protein